MSNTAPPGLSRPVEPRHCQMRQLPKANTATNPKATMSTPVLPVLTTDDTRAPARTAAEYLQQVRATRAKRLAELMATFDNQYEAADELGFSPSYLSRLTRGHEPFGEKIARQLEANFGLEFGALDQER